MELVDAALAGREDAAEQIRTAERSSYLEAILQRRGASATEARDLVADLWVDCFDSTKDRGSLLERYTGKGPLEGFLTRTALNKLIDFKRRQRFQGTLPQQTNEETGQPTDAFDALPGEETDLDTEDSLVEMLRAALVKAFDEADPEKLVILKLVNVHGLDQATVGRMWGWSQSKISRALSSLMEEIREKTVAELKKRDPWLDLHWDDFVALCRESSDIFLGE